MQIKGFIQRIYYSPLFRTSSLYVLANVASASPPFLLLPFLTRSLSQEDYGLVSMFQVLLVIATPFLGLNFHGAISKKFFDLSSDEHAQYVGSSLRLLLGVLGILAVCSLVASCFFKTIFKLSSSWLIIVVLAAFAQAVCNIVLVNMQVRGHAVRYGVFRFCQTLADLLLSFLLVVNLNLSWRGRVLGQFVALLVFAAIGVGILAKWNWIKRSDSKEYARHALSFGLPLIPHALGSVLIAVSDRMFITTLVGVQEMGVYTVGFQVAAAMAMLLNSFNEAWIPWLFSRLNDQRSELRSEIVKVTYLGFLLLLAIALGLGWGAPLIFRVFVGAKFEAGARFVIWLALGHAFSGMYRMVVGYLFYTEKTGRLSIVTMSTALFNIMLSYFLIRSQGSIGAAQATMFANFTAFVLTWIMAAKAFKMPWVEVLRKN